MSESSFIELKKSAIDTGLCCFCGCCISVCPVECIEFGEEGPFLNGDCTECGMCVSACPGLGSPLSDLDRFLFGREKTEEEDLSGYGIRLSERNLVASDKTIFEKGYTGGKITATLTYMLENKIIDAAVVSGWGNNSPFPWAAWPVIATERDTLIQCAGSKYVFSPNLMALKEIEKREDIQKVALVGLGCHLQGLRKLQSDGSTYRSLVEKVKYTFGLYCGAPMVSRENLLRYVSEICNVDALNMSAIDFKRVSKEFDVAFTVSLKSGGTVEKKINLMNLFEKLSRIKRWYRCEFCTDYSAELSDVSFGGVHVTCRTPSGEDIINNALKNGCLEAAVENKLFDQMALEMDRYMARRKKVKHRERIARNRQEGKPVPDFHF